MVEFMRAVNSIELYFPKRAPVNGNTWEVGSYRRKELGSCAKPPRRYFTADRGAISEFVQMMLEARGSNKSKEGDDFV